MTGQKHIEAVGDILDRQEVKKEHRCGESKEDDELKESGFVMVKGSSCEGPGPCARKPWSEWRPFSVGQ